jgi:hypothetical protein
MRSAPAPGRRRRAPVNRPLAEIAMSAPAHELQKPAPGAQPRSGSARAVASGERARAAAPSAVRGGSVAAPRRRRLRVGALGFVAAGALLVFGLTFPLGRYITPTRGLGYALGIAGGSMMLLLFLYSARKRLRWLSFIGPTAGWFRFHMALGILGPLCILYHADFSLGATNSNVALFSMLTVAGSGLVGRYIYSRIHRGVYGQRMTLTELREKAEGLKALSGTVGFLPDLVARLDRVEKRLLAAGPHLPVLSALKLPVIAVMAVIARWRVYRYIRRQLHAAARNSSVVASERKRLARAARAYVDRRIGATRRLAGFQAYERLFSLWHALHLPLIFVLIAAGIVHVIAVNLY